ncbi:DNA topoisomerase 3 [Aureispira sp. CCB-E]|uniref:type IA DNA topoisomerase n=1 Tax=Aureispira sp. CCB-E TaxID=3051121 RepID=UPI0028694530|nr:DNA topoisomerase 3 [Aureispira sp. CCB-E]WMX16296.1 DNA topoisomerase 3 [Aureispira sp. CCB-E]
MKVCIAEKPSVAREIAAIIGAKDKKEGYYEGNGYAVTWTFGHFCTLYAPDDYDAKWKQWNLENLPMLPERFETRLMDNGGVQKQFKIIKDLFKKASVVINCGDAGQEGELIQRWVIKEAQYQGKVLRLWISSLTPEAIRDGFKDLKDASNYDNLYYAGSSRAIGDWLLGMNATRLFTLRYGGYKQVLSIGRVQTPTLAMLVKRHLEIQNFKPEPYWELQTLYRETTFSCTEGKFFKKEDGEALFKKVEGKPFEVTKVTKKNGKELPPKLFDLTSLQVYCNNKFGFSADHTLKIVQKLYEQKLVTYPRVDTTFLPNDVYPKVAGILQKLSHYNTYTQPLLGKKIRKSKKVFNDNKVTDHHAIIPTGYQKGLGQGEQQVYDIITRHFIAAFYPDCLVANTTVLGEVEQVKFKATGKEILEEGWRVVLKAVRSKKKSDEDKTLPTFVKGETGPHVPSFVEKQTQPPKMYTEASLLRAMETAGKQVDDDKLREVLKANGIGRPSTRAAIIETLFKRKYIQRKKKLLVPTEVGLQLIEIIQNELLKSAELTGQWEKQLKEIEDGEYNAAKFIYDMKRMVHQLVAEVKAARYVRRLSAPSKTSKVSVPKPTSTTKKATKSVGILEQTCPKCKKGTLLKGKTSYGCSDWKAGCTFRLPFEFLKKKLSEKQLVRLVSKGSTVKLKGFKKDTEKVDGVLVFDDNFNLKLEAAVPKPNKNTSQSDAILCPKCGKGTVLKGQKAYGCSDWKAGCDFRFEFEEIRKQAAGRKMTKELVLEILKG